MNQLLLAFTDHCPLIDADLLALDGLTDAEKKLEKARKSELIQPQGRGFILTERGKTIRNTLRKQYGLPVLTNDPSPCDSLLTLNRCTALISRSCKGAWGLADWYWHKKLPLAYRAAHPFSLQEPTLTMTWFDDPVWQQINALFPRGKTGDRNPRWNAATTLIGPRQKLSSWQPQLLLLHHFDHAHYETMSHKDTDSLDMVNCDRFFFTAGIESTEQAAEQAALLGQALATQWHLANPVLFDRAEDGVELLNFWTLVTETEQQREILHRTLTPYATQLARGMRPLMILTLSNEELRNPKVQAQTWCDWPGEVPHVLLSFER